MQNFSDDQELFPLSWLSQYAYCPRRCGLLALEQVWEENAETASGHVQHQRVHTARVEHRGNDIFLYELSVYSCSIGVSGKCDCVEAKMSPDGVTIPYAEGKFRFYPVEYKHGIVRQEEEYHIQLCAQAICLEEQFGCTIPTGAIFYINAHRREEVVLTESLRQKTIETAQKVRELISQEVIPVEKYSAKCKKCSMLQICKPKWKRSAKKYCQSLWDLAFAEDEQ